ncbi:hypothetical protein AVEN_118311-1 [Araneus ventricosus]|uniref:Uncharacterized protein n=1 Tax=Araneus ventricosus TaxID=182803 RepID=A0A4Y2RG79_ARAVE|nr:hypothetical protein AVEN_118311-1 [Araneus ventricosus]
MAPPRGTASTCMRSRQITNLAERFNPCHGNLCDNPLPLLTTRFPKPFRQAFLAVWARGGLVVKSRFQGRSSIRLDSIKDPTGMWGLAGAAATRYWYFCLGGPGLAHDKSDFEDQTSSRWCREEVWSRGRLRCRPCHLPRAQNYEPSSFLSSRAATARTVLVATTITVLVATAGTVLVATAITVLVATAITVLVATAITVLVATAITVLVATAITVLVATAGTVLVPPL